MTPELIDYIQDQCIDPDHEIPFKDLPVEIIQSDKQDGKLILRYIGDTNYDYLIRKFQTENYQMKSKKFEVEGGAKQFLVNYQSIPLLDVITNKYPDLKEWTTVKLFGDDYENVRITVTTHQYMLDKVYNDLKNHIESSTKYCVRRKMINSITDDDRNVYQMLFGQIIDQIHPITFEGKSDEIGLVFYQEDINAYIVSNSDKPVSQAANKFIKGQVDISLNELYTN